MNRDHDHDIADLLVRQRNARHVTPCIYADCWCKTRVELESKSAMVKELAAENGIAVLDLKLADSPKLEELEGYPSLSEKITKDWSETALDDYHAPYDMRRKEHILQTLEDEGFDIMELKIADQHPPEDFLNMVDVIKEADLSFGQAEDARVKRVQEVVQLSNHELLSELTCMINYHIVAVGSMVHGRTEVEFDTFINQARQRLKEFQDAKIHRDRVPEDRHSQLLRLGQGDMERPYSVDGCQTGSTGRHGFTGRQSDPVPEECPCSTCSPEG